MADNCGGVVSVSIIVYIYLAGSQNYNREVIYSINLITHILLARSSGIFHAMYFLFFVRDTLKPFAFSLQTKSTTKKNISVLLSSVISQHRSKKYEFALVFYKAIIKRWTLIVVLRHRSQHVWIDSCLFFNIWNTSFFTVYIH